MRVSRSRYLLRQELDVSYQTGCTIQGRQRPTTLHSRINPVIWPTPTLVYSEDWLSMPVDARRPLLEASNGWRDSQGVIDSDPSYDAYDPKRWPAPYKWAIIALLASMAFVVCV